MLWALLLLLFAALYLLSIDYVLIHLTLERMNDSTTVHKQFYTGRINSSFLQTGVDVSVYLGS